MKNRTRMIIRARALSAKFIIALFAIITFWSCGDDDEDSGDLGGESNVRIIEVDAAANQVTLQNFGDGEADISGYWFCLRRNYEQFSDVTVAEGDLILSSNETVTFTIDVTDAGSDVSIYNTGGAFASADALVDFMQFNGSYTDNGREDVAVAKGIWAAGEFVEGASVFTYNGDGTQNGAAQWSGDEVETPNSNVRIIEVDAESDEVTLQNFGEDEIDISGYWFCLRRNYEQFDAANVTAGDLSLAENETVTLSVTVNDEGSDVSIYNTGGAFASAEALVDFMQFNGSYTDNGRENVAVAKGIWTAGEFVEGASLFTYDGDGTQNGAAQWSGDEEEANSNVRIIEVDADSDEVTLQNFGEDEIDISDYWFCLRRNYSKFSDVTISTGDLSLAENETVTFSITVNDDGSDVSIYNTGGSFASAEALVDFMQFNGSYTTNGREDVAVAKGIWTAGEFVEGAAIFTYNGDGTQNGLSFWEGDAAEASIRIVSINPDTESVTIKNLGGTELDISAYEFCLGPGNYNPVNNYTNVTGDFVLSANEEVTIDLTSSNDDVDALPDQGGLGLFKDGNGFGSSSPDQLKDYVQWGAANQPRVGQAVTAQRWDNADNFVSGTAPYDYTGGSTDVGSSFWE
ncbi:MAG: hypothetical protein AAFY41_04440 [Bacteroidota bacterium]